MGGKLAMGAMHIQYFAFSWWQSVHKMNFIHVLLFYHSVLSSVLGL
jgi:hypothetical protein